MEVTLTKNNLCKNEESKIVGFVNGSRREIQNVVEVYEYTSLEKFVYLAIKVESQLLKKSSFKHTHNDGFYNSSWKGKHQFSKQVNPLNSSKESTPQKEHPSPSRTKSPTKTSSTKCFKCLGFGHIVANCPTKRTMLVKGGIVVSDHSDQSSRSNSSSPSKSPSENECEIPCEGDLLVISRMLGTIPKSLNDTQRENIFHTCCLINNKLCLMIINGGSCANVASTRAVEKLGLPIISHTNPYKL